MKKVLGFIWGVLEVIIIVYVIFITSCILCRNKYGFTQFGNYTMVSVDKVTAKHVEKLNVGDLFLVKYSDDIDKGDVMYYYVPANSEYYIKSVVVDSKEDMEDVVIYKTTSTEKPSIASSRVLGKYATTYKGMGKVMDILESRFGFLFLVLLPIMVVFIYQVYQFIITLKYDEVEEEEPKKKDSKKESDVEVL